MLNLNVLLKSIVLLIIVTVMYVSVVVTGQYLPDSSYFITLYLSVFNLLTGIIVSMFIQPTDYNTTLQFLIKGSITLGILRYQNFMWLFLANPYVPGIIQSILNESNIIITFLGVVFILNKPFHYSQIIIIIVVVFTTLILPIIDITTNNGYSILWMLIYFLGVIAIPITGIVTEYAVKQKHEDVGYKYNIPWILTGRDFYMTLLVLLTLAVLSIFNYQSVLMDLHSGLKIISNNLSAFISLNILAVTTYTATLLTAYICRSDDAMLTSLIISLAPPLAGIVFIIIEILVKINIIKIVASIIVLLVITTCILLYKYISYYRRNTNIVDLGCYKYEASNKPALLNKII